MIVHGSGIRVEGYKDVDAARVLQASVFRLHKVGCLIAVAARPLLSAIQCDGYLAESRGRGSGYRRRG